MISIVNVSGHNNELCPERYIVKINRDVVGQFLHYRNTGLIQCLRDCANALEKEHMEANNDQ